MWSYHTNMIPCHSVECKTLLFTEDSLSHGALIISLLWLRRHIHHCIYHILLCSCVLFVAWIQRRHFHVGFKNIYVCMYCMISPMHKRLLAGSVEKALKCCHKYYIMLVWPDQQVSGRQPMLGLKIDNIVWETLLMGHKHLPTDNRSITTL